MGHVHRYFLFEVWGSWHLQGYRWQGKEEGVGQEGLLVLRGPQVVHGAGHCGSSVRPPLGLCLSFLPVLSLSEHRDPKESDLKPLPLWAYLTGGEDKGGAGLVTGVQGSKCLGRGSLAGRIFLRKGRAFGDTVVRFLGPGPAMGQAQGRELCLGSPVWSAHTRIRMWLLEKERGREACG